MAAARVRAQEGSGTRTWHLVNVEKGGRWNASGGDLMQKEVQVGVGQRIQYICID